MKPAAYIEKTLVIEYIEKKLSIVRQRAFRHPEYKIYSDLVSQIEYLKSVLIDPSIDKSKLHKMSFGGGGAAAETLEREDAELAKALGSISYIARRVRSGLKIDLLP